MKNPSLTKHGSSDLSAYIFLFFFPFLFFWEGTLMRVLLGDGDPFIAYIPWRLTVSEAWRNFELPLWNPYWYGGAPLLADIQTGALYPFTFLFLFLKPDVALNLLVLLHYSLAGVFTYLYARSLNLSPLSSLISGVIFQCGGFMLGNQTYTTVICSAAWLPLFLFFLEKLRRQYAVKYIAGGSIALALSFLGCYPQTPVYIAMVGALYVLYFAIFSKKEARWRYLKSALLVYLFAIMLAGPQLFPTYEFKKFTVRDTISYEFFSEASIQPLLLPISLLSLNCLFPFNGVPLEEIAYIGYFSLILAVYGLLRNKNRQAYFWGFMCLLGILLCLGDSTPFYKLMYRVPVYNLFRVASRNLMEVNFALAILAGMGMHTLIVSAKKEIKLGWLLIIGVAALLLNTVGNYYLEDLASGTLLQKSYELGSQLPANILKIKFTFREIAKISGFFIGAGFLGTLLLFALRNYGHYNFMKAIALAVILVNLWHYRGWIVTCPFRDFENAALTTPGTIKYVQQQNKDHVLYRVASAAVHSWVTFNNPLKLEWHLNYNSAAGPGASIYNKLHHVSGYGALIQRDHSRVIGDMGADGVIDDRSIFGPQGWALRILNVKYVFVPELDVSQDENLAKSLNDNNIYKLAYKENGICVYEYLKAQPRFWTVGKVEARGYDEVITIVRKGPDNSGHAVDLSTIALVERANNLPSVLSRDAEIEVKEYKFNRIRLDVDAKGDTFLVSSERYYPGWVAYIDGQRTTIYKTDALLRGIHVPAGKHRVEFRYSPRSFYLGVAAFILAVFLLLFLARKSIISFLLRRPEKRQPEN
jgi:hypothetical protein